MLKKRPYAELEKALGYRFRHAEHLTEALLHRSYRYENPGVDTDNERLEFLGDAVLALLSAAHLHAAADRFDEGTMTAMRSRLISGKTLARGANAIGLGAHLRMGLGEERSGGRERPSNLANALEAVLGAVYLDGGFNAARKVFESILLPHLQAPAEGDDIHNPKGTLQERAQALWKCSPVYEVLDIAGPAHAAHFTVRVRLPDGAEATGQGRSKQAAEAEAAVRLLRAMGSA